MREKAIKSVVDESDRSKSFMIYGTQDNEDDNPQDKANGLFEILNEEEKHVVLSSRRLGVFKQASS
jgi:hypothetical protein